MNLGLEMDRTWAMVPLEAQGREQNVLEASLAQAGVQRLAPVSALQLRSPRQEPRVQFDR